jgi:aromatic ring-opening dioxygenase LigB subunit
MIFLNFDILLIQKICFEVSQTYKMDKRLAYRVFRETEDEFSIRNYVRIDTNESVDR